jgi:hypothetical protein
LLGPVREKSQVCTFPVRTPYFVEEGVLVSHQSCSVWFRNTEKWGNSKKKEEKKMTLKYIGCVGSSQHLVDWIESGVLTLIEG